MREGSLETAMKRIAMAVAATCLVGGLAYAHGDAAAPGGTTGHEDTAAHGGRAAAPAKHAQTPWGVAGDAKAATRTIEITTRDEMRFAPSAFRVAQGEYAESKRQTVSRVQPECARCKRRRAA